jgi:four helix bundle protein
VWIAARSLRELETLFAIALALQYVDENALRNVRKLCDNIGRMLTRLAKRLESPAPRRPLQLPDP